MPVWNSGTAGWISRQDELDKLDGFETQAPIGVNDGFYISAIGSVDPARQSQQHSKSYPHKLSQGSHDIPIMPLEHSPFDGLDMSNAPSGLDTGSPNDLDPHNSLDVVSTETIQAAGAKILAAGKERARLDAGCIELVDVIRIAT